MILKAKDIGVDSGMIIVTDISNWSDILDMNDFYKSKLGKCFDVPNGKYKVKYNIPDTWIKKCKGTELITVTSGKIMVVDPCYIINDDDWNYWLQNTTYGHDLNDNAFIIDSMGGDGVYEVILSLTKVK